jgi:N-acetylneuraminate synthase
VINKSFQFGESAIGVGHPVFIVAEIGINHNGDIQIAKNLIDAAAFAGANAVKFQKRTPKLCVPDDQKEVIRETPWGTMTYLEYRHRMEFDFDQYQELGKYAKSKNLEIFASPWDLPSLDFLISLKHNAIKIASASLTFDELLKAAKLSDKFVIASTGMSTMEQIDHAVSLLNTERLLLCHTTSAYPCELSELNLRMIQTLWDRFQVPIGYSGHEIGLTTSVAAIVLGAVFLERHITLNRAMWGSDQAASVEPVGFAKLVRDVRAVEVAIGDGVKRVYASEETSMNRLRLH